jgi:hypothetical protein
MSASSHDVGPKFVVPPHELHKEVFGSSRRIAPADWLQCAELCTDSRVRDSQQRRGGAILRYPLRVRDRQDSQLPGHDHGYRTHGRTLLRHAAARRREPVSTRFTWSGATAGLSGDANERLAGLSRRPGAERDASTSSSPANRGWQQITATPTTFRYQMPT